MDQPKIIEIVQSSRTQDANNYLAAGWLLLATATGQDESGYPLTTYSLGRTESSEEVQRF